VTTRGAGSRDASTAVAGVGPNSSRGLRPLPLGQVVAAVITTAIAPRCADRILAVMTMSEYDIDGWGEAIANLASADKSSVQLSVRMAG
jgi:hypothetical protein